MKLRGTLLAAASLCCGVWAGWIATSPQSKTAQPKSSGVKGQAAMPVTSSKSAAPEMNEMLVRLYDAWDEQSAVEWMREFSESELLLLLQKLKSWQNQASRSRAAHIVREMLARKNFTKALEDALKEPDGNKENAIGTLCGWLALQSPEKALALLRQHLEGLPGQESGETKFFERWMKGDIEAALRYMDKHPEDKAAESGLRLYAKQVPAEKLPDLASRVAALVSGEQRGNALYNVTNVWAEIDPPAACRFCLAMKEFPSGVNIRLSEWISVDAQAATMALQQLPPSEKRTELIQCALPFLLDGQQVELALQLLSHEKPSDLDLLDDSLFEFSGFIKTFVITPTQFETFYSGLPESSAKHHLQSKMVDAWVDRLQFKPAIELVAKMEGASKRATLLQNIAEKWYQWSPTEATNWMAAFPPGKEREAVLFGIGSAIAIRSPEEATLLLPQLQDVEHRAWLIQRIATNWRLVDKASLRTWLEGFPEVSRVQRAELLLE